MQFAHRLRDGRQVVIRGNYHPSWKAPRDCWGQPTEPDEPAEFDAKCFEDELGFVRPCSALSDLDLAEIEGAALALTQLPSADPFLEDAA